MAPAGHRGDDLAEGSKVTLPWSEAEERLSERSPCASGPSFFSHQRWMLLDITREGHSTDSTPLKRNSQKGNISIESNKDLLLFFFLFFLTNIFSQTLLWAEREGPLSVHSVVLKYCKSTRPWLLTTVCQWTEKKELTIRKQGGYWRHAFFDAIPWMPSLKKTQNQSSSSHSPIPPTSCADPQQHVVTSSSITPPCPIPRCSLFLACWNQREGDKRTHHQTAP